MGDVSEPLALNGTSGWRVARSRTSSIAPKTPRPLTSPTDVCLSASSTSSRSIWVPRTDAFDEIALFVLVRRDGAWWLAAGLHTRQTDATSIGDPVVVRRTAGMGGGLRL